MPSDLMNVTPENVLQARAVILAELESFMEHLGDSFFLRGTPLIGLCGGDPISRDAQDLFTKKIQENAVAPAQQYARRLRDIADQLGETARAFGITEQRITDSFKSAALPGSQA